jgi:hypothetical protein
MTTTIRPTGLPAWTRTATFEQYGGHTAKENFLGRSAINPVTDVDATEFSRMTTDLAVLVRTAPFAVMTIVCQDTQHRGFDDEGQPIFIPGPATPLIEYAALMTGVRNTIYEGDAPPTGYPSVVRTGTGEFTVTFATSYADEYGVAAAYAPRAAQATVAFAGGSAACAHAWVTGQTVQVALVADTGGTAADQRVSLIVW